MHNLIREAKYPTRTVEYLTGENQNHTRTAKYLTGVCTYQTRTVTPTARTVDRRTRTAIQLRRVTSTCTIMPVTRQNWALRTFKTAPF